MATKKAVKKPSPPQDTELELSVFGAGIGECLVVHLGYGEWMVVDSCWNAKRDAPISLEYLESLGVDVAKQVQCIVVTHWHDDHIAGINQLVDLATSAEFVCSAALGCKEFLSLVTAGKRVKTVQHTSGISEFEHILEILQSRSGSRHAVGPDHWASHAMKLYCNDKQNLVEVHSLSPSASTITDAIGKFAELMPKAGSPIRQFRATSPNDHSVSLLVSTPTISFLLGGDLVIGSDDKRGWRAVVASKAIPKRQSSIFKIPHHGSEGADHDLVWKQLLAKDPYALVTPYGRGKKKLPSQEDVNRIKKRSNNVLCTAWPATVKPIKRRGAVDRMIRPRVLSHHKTRKTPGHIRIRSPIDGTISDLSVELYDPACEL